LTADQSGRCRGTADDLDHAQLSSDEIGLSASRLARQQGEGFCLKAVAREDGDPVAVDHMQGRAAAAQRVVVHGREVVVNQRICMDELDRARGGQCRLSRRSQAVPAHPRDGVSGGERQDRAQPLAAGEYAVAHRFADDGGALGRLGKIALQREVDLDPSTVEKVGE